MADQLVLMQLSWCSVKGMSEELALRASSTYVCRVNITTCAGLKGSSWQNRYLSVLS